MIAEVSPSPYKVFRSCRVSDNSSVRRSTNEHPRIPAAMQVPLLQFVKILLIGHIPKLERELNISAMPYWQILFRSKTFKPLTCHPRTPFSPRVPRPASAALWHRSRRQRLLPGLGSCKSLCPDDERPRDWQVVQCTVCTPASLPHPRFSYDSLIHPNIPWVRAAASLPWLAHIAEGGWLSTVI